MKSATRWVPICALILVIASGLSLGQGVYNKTAFETVMDDTVKQMRVTLGTLVGGDWGKTQDGAVWIAAQAKKIRALTPPVAADKYGEFQAHADTLGAYANRLADASKARDTAKAAAVYGQMLATCMDCHKTFRK